MKTLKFNKEQMEYLYRSMGNKIIEFYANDNGEIQWLLHKEDSTDFLENTDSLEDSIEITLCGKRLLIDKENLEIDGKKYFMHDEAMDIAKTQGKRLLTKEEYEDLVKLPNKWDREKKGMWFGELFFPATGCRPHGSGSLVDLGTNGYYWSASGTGGNGYYLFFSYNGGLNHRGYDNRSYGFSVRCVMDI